MNVLGWVTWVFDIFEQYVLNAVPNRFRPALVLFFFWLCSQLFVANSPWVAVTSPWTGGELVIQSGKRFDSALEKEIHVCSLAFVGAKPHLLDGGFKFTGEGQTDPAELEFWPCLLNKFYPITSEPLTNSCEPVEEIGPKGDRRTIDHKCQFTTKIGVEPGANWGLAIGYYYYYRDWFM